MSVTKRISTGDYNLTTTGVDANVIITTDTLKIYGNLYVQGNTSVVNVANISTADPMITLNANAASIYPGNSGIEIYRAGSNMPAIFWNETYAEWEFATNIADPTTYHAIGSGFGAGNVNVGTASQLAYYQTTGNTVSNVGGNLTWTSNNTLTVTGNVRTTGLQLPNLSSALGTIAGNVTLSGNTQGNLPGGTGVFFNNNTESGELISKRRALAFSIIFG